MVPFIILGLGRCSEDPVLFQTCCRRQQNVVRSDKPRFVTFFSETLESLLPVPKCMYLGAWILVVPFEIEVVRALWPSSYTFANTVFASARHRPTTTYLVHVLYYL